MTQFDVFANPVANARTIYPYVVVLQSGAAKTRNEVVVAPITRRANAAGASGRLTPVIRIDDRDYVVVTASLTTLPAADLKRKVTSLAQYRSDLLGAVDLLFFGI